MKIWGFFISFTNNWLTTFNYQLIIINIWPTFLPFNFQLTDSTEEGRTDESLILISFSVIISFFKLLNKHITAKMRELLLCLQFYYCLCKCIYIFTIWSCQLRHRQTHRQTETVWCLLVKQRVAAWEESGGVRRSKGQLQVDTGWWWWRRYIACGSTSLSLNWPVQYCAAVYCTVVLYAGVAGGAGRAPARQPLPLTSYLSHSSVLFWMERVVVVSLLLPVIRSLWLSLPNHFLPKYSETNQRTLVNNTQTVK